MAQMACIAVWHVSGAMRPCISGQMDLAGLTLWGKWGTIHACMAGVWTHWDDDCIC